MNQDESRPPPFRRILANQIHLCQCSRIDKETNKSPGTFAALDHCSCDIVRRARFAVFGMDEALMLRKNCRSQAGVCLGSL